MPPHARKTVRLEAYHESEPDRCVLVSVVPGCSLDELCDAVHGRLGSRPEKLCLGETQAQVVDSADLREGDVLRVVRPPLAPAAGTERASWLASPKLEDVLHHVVTLLVFFVLYQGLQVFVYFPLFRSSANGEQQGIAPYDAGPEHRLNEPSYMHPR